MPRISHEGYGRLASYIAAGIAFVMVSYVVRGHEDAVRLFLAGGGVFGAALFVFFTAIFVVFVIPLDIVFLIPLGVALWGPLPTALLSITGWTLGASVAFSLARRYGAPLVIRMVGERKIREFHDRIPRSDLFWSVIVLRMLVPVDLLSYALGLFSQISTGPYLLATVIGVAPFGFFFAFAGALPLPYQILAIAIALVFAFHLLRQYLRSSRGSDDGLNPAGRE